VKTASRGAKTEPKSELRRENGLSLIMIGLMLWFFDALIVFFMPAGVRLGHQWPFVILTLSVFVAGAITIALGAHMRKQ
jgi:hypothetical protein